MRDDEEDDTVKCDVMHQHIKDDEMVENDTEAI